MTTLYYQLQKSCRLRRKTNLIDLVPLLHQETTRSLLIGQARLSRSKSEPLPPGRLSCQVELGTDKHQQVSLDAEEAIRRIDWVRRARRQCRDCPANRNPYSISGDQALGCLGSIPLPIGAHVEQALLDVIEELLDDSADLEPTVTLPIRFIWDNGLSGEEIGAMRKRPDVFASAEPVEARIGPFLQKQPLNTDQFLSLFMLPGRSSKARLHLFSAFATELVERARERTDGSMEALKQLVPFFDLLATASDLSADVDVVYVSSAAELVRQELEASSKGTPPPATSLTDSSAR